MTDQMCDMGHSWDGSALPVADSAKYSPAVRFSVELDGLPQIPAQLKQDLDEGRHTVFYRFKTPLTDEEMSAADFLAGRLDQALEVVIEDWHYFRAMWHPDEQGNFVLGMQIEMDEDVEDDTSGFDSDSPEAKALIKAIAEAFDLDPADLGEGGDEGDEPIEEPVAVIEGETGGGVVMD